MKVYRIEHKYGCGIFRAKKTLSRHYCEEFSFYNELLNKWSRFPTPYFDNISHTSDYYFAFKTLNQLKYWFKKEWREEVKKLGFSVFEIELKTKNLKIGKKQVAFLKSDIINKTIIEC